MIFNNLNKMLLSFSAGCRVETIPLEIEAVDTHRPKPNVSTHFCKSGIM